MSVLTQDKARELHLHQEWQSNVFQKNRKLVEMACVYTYISNIRPDCVAKQWEECNGTFEYSPFFFLTSVSSYLLLWQQLWPETINVPARLYRILQNLYMLLYCCTLRCFVLFYITAFAFHKRNLIKMILHLQNVFENAHMRQRSNWWINQHSFSSFSYLESLSTNIMNSRERGEKKNRWLNSPVCPASSRLTRTLPSRVFRL